jgi:hypothetical protein
MLHYKLRKISRGVRKKLKFGKRKILISLNLNIFKNGYNFDVLKKKKIIA